MSIAQIIRARRAAVARTYTLTLRATDKSGLTSLPARRTFSHG